jgi:hypothetical protein
MSIDRLFFSIVVVVTFLLGCGGGGGSSNSDNNSGTYSGVGSMSTGDGYNSSSSSGSASYYLSVSDDLIIGARLSATKIIPDKYGVNRETEVCGSFTELGGGLYSLNNCSAKPVFVTAIGGFIDIDGNGRFDANEPTQNSPLIVDTTVLTDTNFTITPISTLAAGYSSVSGANRSTLATKLGFGSRVEAYRATSANQPMNRMVNALLSAAVGNGMEIRKFTADLATRIVASDGAGVDALRAAISSFINAPENKIAYGDAQIQSFWNDARVQAVINGTDAMSAMLAKKVPSGKLRISGLVTTYITGSNVVSGATVGVYVGATQLGSGVSDKYGKYSIEVNETSVPKNATLLLSAQTSTLKLTSSVPTNVIWSKRVNGHINTSFIGSLAISYVTTVMNDNNNSVQSGATVKKLMFDTTYYTGKNSSNSTFFTPMTILSENQLLPNVTVATMKLSDIDTGYLTLLAKSLPVSSVPIVLDIESWPLPFEISSGNDVIVNNTVAMYTLVMNTMKAARPELKFGFFGTIPSISSYGPGTITQIMIDQAEHLYNLTLPIAQASDFVTPELYTYWTDSTIYFRMKNIAFDMAKRYNKPLLPFLWAEYTDGMPQVGTYLPDTYWQNQVILARDRGDSMIIWGGSNFAVPSNDPNRIRSWDENISWWNILKANVNIQ